jgi:hypothetical protein
MRDASASTPLAISFRENGFRIGAAETSVRRTDWGNGEHRSARTFVDHDFTHY